jgi:peroxiredoxin family protein
MIFLNCLAILRKYEFEDMIHHLNRLEFSDIDMEEMLKLTTKQKIKNKKIHSLESLYDKEVKSKSRQSMTKGR